MPNDMQQVNGQRPQSQRSAKQRLRMMFLEMIVKEKMKEKQAQKASETGTDLPTNKMAKTELTPYHYERNRLAVETVERIRQQRLNPAKTSLPLLMLTATLLMQVFTSCNDREIEQQKQVLEPPIQKRLTWAEIDSLNKVEKDALIAKYSALLIEDTTFTFTYQAQDFFDTTALFALEGGVVDIFRHDNQMTLIFDLGNLGNDAFFQTSIPMEMFEARKTDFEHETRYGIFIVNVRNTQSTIISHIVSEVSDYSISDSGELEDVRIYQSERLEPTLFLHGELIDFYINQER